VNGSNADLVLPEPIKGIGPMGEYLHVLRVRSDWLPV